MIAVIKTGSNVSGMVMYNQKKTTIKNKSKKAQFLAAVNFRASKPKQIIHVIENYNIRNSNISKPNLHISLSFPKEEDYLNNEQMLNIAKQYMNKMDYGEQPFAIYRHYDRPHPHIHIVSTQIDRYGKKINDSHLFRRSFRVSREIEIGNKLLPGNKKVKNIAFESNISIDKNGITNYLNSAIEQILKNKPTTFKQFDNFLKDYKIARVEGEEGIFYKFLEEENHPILKPNDLYENYNNAYLEQQFSVFLNQKNKYKKNIQGKIYAVLNKLDKPIAIDALKTLLIKKGIDINFKYRKTGDKIGLINGVSFKDKTNNINYNASDLGISTLKFVKSYIVKKDQYKGESKSIGASPDPTYQNTRYSIPTKNSNYNFTEIISNLFNTDSIPISENQEDIRKKKKKKKNRL